MVRPCHGSAIAFVAVIMSVHDKATQCQACQWYPDSASVVYDLSRFEEQARTTTQTAKVITLEGGIVYFDLCNPVKPPPECPGDTVRDAPAFKTIQQLKNSQCLPLGSMSERTWSLLDRNNPVGGFRLFFAGFGSFKAFAINVTCSRGAGVGTAVAVNCDILPPTATVCELTLASDVGCGMPVFPWALFLVIALAVSLAIYCAVGIAINLRKGMGCRIEAIPHVNFWREVPSLVREGIVFSILKCRGRWRRSQYRDIDGDIVGAASGQKKAPLSAQKQAAPSLKRADMDGDLVSAAKAARK